MILFVITCLSTFWAGATDWTPTSYLAVMGSAEGMMVVRRTLIRNWDQGLIYMGCLLAILFCHEMGHFLATIRYRIPASLPFFIPLPITPIGTMGAVIGMDGLRANRREMFDIGLAGPLAGLAVAVPVLWIGIGQLDFTQPAPHPTQYDYVFDKPLLAKVMLEQQMPPGYRPDVQITLSRLNAYFMAGWVGLLITGLNMLPVSQLDGGHVIYTLFGKWAHWMARAFLIAAIAALVIYWEQVGIWVVFVIIITLLGTDHPPTSNDKMRLGWFRTLLGLAALSIPVLCFPVYGIYQAGR